MKQYPSILTASDKKAEKLFGKRCHIFNKYDGSNLRWEWSQKRGWYKYGTRHRLFDHTDDTFGGAIQLFPNTFGNMIETIVLQHYNTKDFIAYTEFLGDNSFAGYHDPNDVKRLVLFDVWIDRKGFIPPSMFVDMFGDYNWSAELLDVSVFTKADLVDIYNGKYGDGEGVIVKATNERGEQIMTKAKTKVWLDKVHAKHGQDAHKYI